ncbi:hypothetical protein [Sedimentitalea sp.]|uniref:hypothetical protein n=1 Tax=Sedimentitalea sp. TaxID=2048915 RepID=UPI003299558C
MIVTRTLRPPRVTLGDAELDLNPRSAKHIARSATEALHTAPPTTIGVKQAHIIQAGVASLVEPLEQAAMTFLAAAAALRGEPSDDGDALTETCREIVAYGTALHAVEPDLDLDTGELEAQLEAVAGDYAAAAQSVKSRALKLDTTCKSLTARAIRNDGTTDADVLALHSRYELPDEIGRIDVPSATANDRAGFLRSQVKLGLLRVEDARRAKRETQRANETRDVRLRIREIWNA